MTITALGILAVKKLLGTKITPRGHMRMWCLLLVVWIAGAGNSLIPESELSLRNWMPQMEQNVQKISMETAVQPGMPENTAVKDASLQQDRYHTTQALYIPGAGPVLEREYYENRQQRRDRGWLNGMPMLVTIPIAWILLQVTAWRQKKKLEALPDANPETDEGRRTLEILRELQEELGITTPIRVKTGAETTLLAYHKKPMICLEDGYSDAELRHVFAHELTHYRHGDLWRSEFFAVIACVYWWNPVSWIAFRRFRHDQEVYCDYDAARLTGDRKAYARLLVKAAAQKRFMVGTTSLLRGEKEVSRRVKSLAKFRQPASWLCGLATLGLVILAVSLALNPMPKNPDGQVQNGGVVQNISYEQLPFSKREFTLGSFILAEEMTQYNEGLVYKTDTDTRSERNFLVDYRNRVYAFQDGDFVITEDGQEILRLEEVWLAAEAHPDGGEIYISRSGEESSGVAAVIPWPYTEYRMQSTGRLTEEYRLYAIQRDGQDIYGDYRDFWLGYFKEECQYILYMGWEFDVTAVHEIGGSFRLLERVYGKYDTGDNVAYFLRDEEAGTEIPLYTDGYADFLEAVDENHLIFYCKGRNHITDAYHEFPYLHHLVREDSSVTEFQEYREDICFPLDEVTEAGKAADCLLEELRFTEDGVELTVTADPASPMGFYAAYSDAVLTQVSYEEEQHALRLHTHSITAVNEDMLNELDVPETHPYIRSFAVERYSDGADILLYLKEGAHGYYGETDSRTDSNHPKLKVRLTGKQGVRY